MARTDTEQIPSEETATVLLTAVERSTLLEATSHGAAAAVTRQYELVEAAMRAHGAVRSVRTGQHDGVLAVFRSSAGAVAAALAVQRALAAEQWPGGAGSPGWAIGRPDSNLVGDTRKVPRG